MFRKCGCSAIAPEENCPHPKTNPKRSQTLTLTEGKGNFSWGHFSGCPLTLKLTLILIQTPNLIWVKLSLGRKSEVIKLIH